MILGQFFVKNAKMTLEHFLNGPNQTKFENRENAKISGNSVKNGHFRPSKCRKLVILQDINLKFCTHMHLTGFFRIYSVFLIQKLTLKNFDNYIFLAYFSNFTKN